MQARIRGGADAADVAAALDVDVDYVRRFEGPVLAERAFILDAARRVSVTPVDDEAPDTFGEAITAKLEAGEATGVQWVRREARRHRLAGPRPLRRRRGRARRQWRFDPKTSTLVPDNGDAHRLSHTDDEGIAPRLRAVEFDHEDADGTRFDSGAFRVESADDGLTNPEVAERAPLRAPRSPHRRGLPRSALPATRPPTCSRPSVAAAVSVRPRRSPSTRRSPAGPRSASSTCRCTASRTRRTPPPAGRARPSSAPEPEARDRKKRSRRSMPSWDEIVFGTRPEDPA